MKIVNNNIFTQFKDVGLGLVFVAENNDCYMRIEDVVCKKYDFNGFGYEFNGNAIRLKDGLLSSFDPDENVLLVDCQLIIE